MPWRVRDAVHATQHRVSLVQGSATWQALINALWSLTQAYTMPREIGIADGDVKRWHHGVGPGYDGLTLIMDFNKA